MSIFQFIMTYNFDRPEKEVLCDLVYVNNKYKLYPHVVEFGTPMELDQRPDIEDDANTYIDAVVDRNFDYRLIPGETGFLYHRIPLAALRMVDESIIVPPTLPFKTYDILDQINRQLGARLTQDDLENIQYTTLDDVFTIKAKPTSRIWTGERTILVEGGGHKNMLYPSFLLALFSSPLDVSANPKAQILALANSSNNVSWVDGLDLTLGSAEAAIGAGGGRNARIYVTSHKEDYTDQWLYYRRCAPSEINDQFSGGVVPKVVVPNTPFTVYSILDQINLVLNLHLTANDVVNTAFQPGASEYAIVFKPGSIGFTAGTYMLQVAYEQPEVPPNVRLLGDGSYRASAQGVPRSYV